jgi:hypothetical protein
MLRQAQHKSSAHLTQRLLSPGIFLLLQIVDISIYFDPHPASPKSDDVNFESTFGLFLVVFGGGAEGGGGDSKNRQ